MKSLCLILTGSVAVVKVNELIDNLVEDYRVSVIYTKSSEVFLNQYELVNNSKLVGIYKDEVDIRDLRAIEHIRLASLSDIVLIAPASYNYINCYAGGIASSFSLSMLAACDPSKVIVAPAMNTKMFENPILQRNIDALKLFGVRFIDPVVGLLACNDVGIGKLEDPVKIKQFVDLMTMNRGLGRVVVTCGSSKLYIDPVRYISNRSSGKFGVEIAREFALAGYDVDLLYSYGVDVSGVENLVRLRCYETNVELGAALDEVVQLGIDAVIMAAAPVDYDFVAFDSKLKSDVLDLSLNKGRDLIGSLNVEGVIKFGFALETEDHLINGQNKLVKKGLDYILVNDKKTMGSDFVYNASIVSKDGYESFVKISKCDLAKEIVKNISNEINARVEI